MQTANVAAMKYLCVKTAVADYLCEALGMTLEEVTASRGYDVPEEMIAQLNSPKAAARRSARSTKAARTHSPC